MTRLFCVKIDTIIPKNKFDHLLSCVSNYEQEKILKLLKYEDRLRSLFGKLLLFWILKKSYEVDNAPGISYDKYDRPYQNLVTGLDFNISHSGNRVICGISDKGRIGVDVEKIQPVDLQIARTYFAKEEVDELNNLSGKDRIYYFYHIWTLKEAYIKSIGSTFLIPLDGFWFDISSHNLPRLNIKDNFPYSPNYIFKSYNIDKDYILSVCADNQNILDNVIIIDHKHIIDFFQD